MNLGKTLLIITGLNLCFSLVICDEISSKFHEYKIVPKIIPTAPTELLKITYNTGYKANLGNEIPNFKATDIPDLEWDADPNSFYLMTMIDPDFPGAGIPQLFHWIVGNIPGNNVPKGEPLASYITPMPPAGSPPHRYIFLIYKQPGKVDYSDGLTNVFLAKGRVHPSLEKVLKEKGINDEPLAGNFFRSHVL